MLIQARYIFSPIYFFPLYIFILRALRLRLMIKDAVSNSWVNRHWKKLVGQLISNSVYQVFHFCDIKRTFVQKFAFKTHRIKVCNNFQDERWHLSHPAWHVWKWPFHCLELKSYFAKQPTLLSRIWRNLTYWKLSRSLIYKLTYNLKKLPDSKNWLRHGKRNFSNLIVMEFFKQVVKGLSLVRRNNSCGSLRRTVAAIN